MWVTGFVALDLLTGFADCDSLELPPRVNDTRHRHRDGTAPLKSCWLSFEVHRRAGGGLA